MAKNMHMSKDYIRPKVNSAEPFGEKTPNNNNKTCLGNFIILAWGRVKPSLPLRIRITEPKTHSQQEPTFFPASKA